MSNTPTPAPEVTATAAVTKARIVLGVLGLLLTVAIVLYVIFEARTADEPAATHAEVQQDTVTITGVLPDEDATAEGSEMGRPLTFADIEEIAEIVADAGVGTVTMTEHLTLNGGISNEAGDPVSLVAINAAASELAGLASMDDDVLYSLDQGTGQKPLVVSVISELTDGTEGTGVVSEESQELTFESRGGLDSTRMHIFGNDGPNELLVVTLPTFWKIAELQFDAEKVDIMRDFDAGEIPMFSFVSSVVVRAHDAKDVADLNTAISDAGFETQAVWSVLTD